MNMDDMHSEVKQGISRLQGQVDEFATKNKKRLGEVVEKQGELQARIQELEQRAVRGEHRSGASSQRHGAFSAAADDLLAGLRGTNSSRVELAFSIKAALSDADHTFPPERLEAVSGYGPALARLIDLLPSRKVTANTVSYLRVGFSTDSPGGNAAGIVSELQSKPESSVVATPISAEMLTFAHFIESSKQLLDDQPELGSVLDGPLRGGVLDVIDLHIFQVLTTSGNYVAFTPVSGETVADGIARIAAQVASRGGSNIVVATNPGDYLSMQLAKADTSGAYLGLPPSGLAARVVSAPAVDQGTLLAFAPGTGAAWADRETVNLTMGLRNDQFTRNAVTLLAEARGEGHDSESVAHRGGQRAGRVMPWLERLTALLVAPSDRAEFARLRARGLSGAQAKRALEIARLQRQGYTRSQARRAVLAPGRHV